MAQPIKNKEITNNHRQKKVKTKKTVKRDKPKYGTSKLEETFAKGFLDKLNVKYTYQFEVKEIGRFYDFLVETESGSKIIIEIDGDYW